MWRFESGLLVWMTNTWFLCSEQGKEGVYPSLQSTSHCGLRGEERTLAIGIDAAIFYIEASGDTTCCRNREPFPQLKLRVLKLDKRRRGRTLPIKTLSLKYCLPTFIKFPAVWKESTFMELPRTETSDNIMTKIIHNCCY